MNNLLTSVSFTFKISNHKRAFNLLGGLNQGCDLLLARGLEKRKPVAKTASHRYKGCTYREKGVALVRGLGIAKYWE